MTNIAKTPLLEDITLPEQLDGLGLGDLLEFYDSDTLLQRYMVNKIELVNNGIRVNATCLYDKNGDYMNLKDSHLSHYGIKSQGIKWAKKR